MSLVQTWVWAYSQGTHRPHPQLYFIVVLKGFESKVGGGLIVELFLLPREYGTYTAPYGCRNGYFLYEVYPPSCHNYQYAVC